MFIQDFSPVSAGGDIIGSIQVSFVTSINKTLYLSALVLGSGYTVPSKSDAVPALKELTI